MSTNPKYYKKYPERKKANDLLNREIKRGKVEKEECYFCGSRKHVVGHHPDYSKPLDVIWLCNRCHRRLHLMLAKYYSVVVKKW